MTGVDTSKPGFKARMYQMDRWRSPGDQNITPVGERQLAFGFIDPLTHLPYPDVSTQDYSLLDTNGYFNIEGVLNFEQTGANAGQISGATDPVHQESLFPGIPGNSTLDASMGNFGGHRLGLFADDRFRFSFGPSFGAVGTAPQAASTGANADTVFDIVIPADDYYPFRCSYWEGGGGASYEFYWVEPGTNKKILVNDPELTQSPRAYREATNSRPWIQRVLPVENWVGAFPNEDVTATIIDGAIPVDGNSISTQINNVNQTITKSKSLCLVQTEANGLPYANIADPGPNGNFTADFDLVNFNISFTAPTATAPGVYASGNTGFFQSGAPAAPLPGGSKTELPMPGTPSPTYTEGNGVAAGNINPSNGGLDNYVMEMTTYLDLKKGVHMFGFNSDDGFVCTSAPNIPFSFTVPEAGLYPIRAVYYQGGGGAGFELFSYDQFGSKIPINDPNNSNSIKAFYKLASSNAPHLITSLSGITLTISWTGGGELQSATDVTGPWSGTGNSTGTATVTIPAGAATQFYRVKL